MVGSKCLPSRLLAGSTAVIQRFLTVSSAVTDQLYSGFQGTRSSTKITFDSNQKLKDGKIVNEILATFFVFKN